MPRPVERSDVETLLPGGLNSLEYILELPKILFACCLKVVDFGADSGFSCDGNKLVNSLLKLTSFTAHVRDVSTTVVGRDFTKRN